MFVASGVARAAGIACTAGIVAQFSLERKTLQAMHPRPRRTLRRLFKKYGQDLLDNPARVDALLADHCGKYRAERFVLVCALRERVSAANLSPEYWIKSCSQRLQSQYCFSAEAAQWATKSWSSALRNTLPDPSALGGSRDSHNGLHAELSKSPIRILSRLLTDHGVGLLEEPTCVDALLADLCGEFDRERFLHIHALREGIPTDLLSRRRGIASGRLRLTRRLWKAESSLPPRPQMPSPNSA